MSDALFADGKMLTALRCIAAEVKRCGVPDYSIAWDDLVQIGAEAMLLKAQEYDPTQGASRTHWARVCARSAMMNAREHCRRRAALVSMLVTSDPLSEAHGHAVGAAPSVEEIAEQQQQHRRLHAALANLTAPERQLLALVDLCEIPTVVIASREGVKPCTISARRKHAMASLREAVGACP